MDSSSRYQLQQQHQPNSGLLRFRSAPSSVGANFKHGEGGAANNGNNNNNPWENFEPAERLVLRFMDSGESNDTASPSNNKAANESSSSLSRMNSQQGYSTTISGASSSMLQVGSMGMDHPKSFNSHLLRQSSFPAGHFSNVISFQNGVGNYGGANGSDGELSLSMNTLKNQIGFSQRSPSSLGMLSSQTSKMGSEGIGTTGRDDGRQVGGNGDARYFGPKFPYHSYDQNGELGNQVHTLSHHLSLPRKSSEMFVLENLLQFPDSVPSGIRAKRGFATHPRSIAERVRRTRISERIRKLQELVPNIDKQTSTADMLDLAVEYIKDLQKQFKTLSEKRAKCKCISMQKSETNQIA